MKCFGEKPKVFHCKVILLDDTELIHEVQNVSPGQVLLDIVNRHLNLLETAYFGLKFIDKTGQTHWLDSSKKIYKQVKGITNFTFYFGVKYYASDPCKLLEEVTRYQFFLQLKRDIYHGRLPVPSEVAPQLFAYALQSELGDYDSRRHGSRYATDFRFHPDQSDDLEHKAMALHRTLVGEDPPTAELNFLEKVKWLEMYGVDLHSVLGEDSIEYFLGLSPSGILVLRNKTKVGNYYWPRITKVYYKGSYFMLQVKDKSNDEMTYGFELSNKQACKHLWRCCVDHHSFFRLTQQNESDSAIKSKLFGFGTRLRNSIRRSGRRNRPQLDATKRGEQPTPLVRTPSKRYNRRMGEPDGADAVNDNVESKTDGIGMCSSAMYRCSSAPGLNNSTKSAWESTKPCVLSSSGSQGRIGASRTTLHSQHGSRSSINSNRSTNSRKRHRSRHSNLSDNESEISRSSRGSRCSRMSRASSGCRHSCASGRDSGSESEGSRNHRHRHRHRHHHHHHHSETQLVDSGEQWREIQRRHEMNTTNNSRSAATNRHTIAQSAVVRDLTNGQRRQSGYMPEAGAETEQETEEERNVRRRLRHRRSKSPASRHAMPDDLRRHIEFGLIDPENVPEEDRNIRYTRVETETDQTTSSRLFKIRHAQIPQSATARLARLCEAPPKPQEASPPPPYASCDTNGLPNNTYREETKSILVNGNGSTTSSSSRQHNNGSNHHPENGKINGHSTSINLLDLTHTTNHHESLQTNGSDSSGRFTAGSSFREDYPPSSKKIFDTEPVNPPSILSIGCREGAIGVPRVTFQTPPVTISTSMKESLANSRNHSSAFSPVEPRSLSLLPPPAIPRAPKPVKTPTIPPRHEMATQL